jgi:hypothetical protein
MILEWRPSPDTHNLGDHLNELLCAIYTRRSQRGILNGTDAYILLGSVIRDRTIRRAIGGGRMLHLLACGYRGEEINGELVRSVVFGGCRGPLTKAALERAGVRNVNIVGDTALLLPLLVAPRKSRSGRALLVPHVLDPKRNAYRAEEFGCDSILDPVTVDNSDLYRKITEIITARFVLTGAMHAAIIAHCYDVPFAFLEMEYRDCPAKWEDWALSIGLRKTTFHSHLEPAEAWYASTSELTHKRPMLPLLREAARFGNIRPRIWATAILNDLRLRTKNRGGQLGVEQHDGAT